MGIEIPFKSEPEPCFYDNNVFSLNHKRFVDEEIQRLLKSGAIKQVKIQPKCVLSMRCVPKKNKKFRLVIDCRPINKFIDTPSFTQEGISAVAELIEPEVEIITIDIKNGFHHVPINEKHQKYVGIFWRDKFYAWQVWCFGISCAPYYFHKTVRPMVVFYVRMELE